ncbi:MAG: OmpH family outer membrane protein [Verrucomicrobiales bacterium]|nr:OmpH family outer membrane protein [Verrucomicrobiales bacterium]
MKSLTPKVLLAALSLAFASFSAQAQVKMGIVDLRKVFDGYHKTRDADAKIKAEASELEKNAKGMLEDYRKANEEYKGLVEAAGDAAISADEKQKRRKAAEDKLLEIRNLEQQVQQFQRQSESTLLEKRKRMRDQILREIRETVVAKSKAAGYTFVIDVAADSVNQTPIVLYTNGENDLTEELLRQLNANAPAGSLLPSAGDKK